MISISNKFNNNILRKRIKIRAQLKKKKKEKAKTMYLKRKKSSKAFRNYEKLFISEVSWQLQHQLKRKWSFVNKIKKKFSDHLVWFKFFYKSRKRFLNKVFSVKKGAYNKAQQFTYLNLPILKLAFLRKLDLNTVSYLLKGVEGVFNKNGKKKSIQRQVCLAFFFAAIRSKKNIYYLLFYLSYWYKLPVYYKIFSIYTRQIKIPILLNDNLVRSSSIVSKWIKGAVLESKELKLYKKLGNELDLFLTRAKESKILYSEYRFSQDLRVNVVDNIQYLQIYNWEFR